MENAVTYEKGRGGDVRVGFFRQKGGNPHREMGGRKFLTGRKTLEETRERGGGLRQTGKFPDASRPLAGEGNLL